MSALLASLWWDLRLQLRYYFWLVAVVVTVLWLALLLNVSDAVRASWIPVLIFTDLGNIGLLFIAGILYLERRQGTLYAVAVTPLSRQAWLSSKVLSLGLLSTVCALFIVLFNSANVVWWRILPASFVSGALFTSLGFLLVLPFDRIMNYFLGMGLGMMLLNLPILYYFDILPGMLMWALPTQPVLQLLAGSYQEMPLMEWVAYLLLSLVWLGISHAIGVKGLSRYIAMRPQA